MIGNRNPFLRDVHTGIDRPVHSVASIQKEAWQELLQLADESAGIHLSPGGVEGARLVLLRAKRAGYGKSICLPVYFRKRQRAGLEFR